MTGQEKILAMRRAGSSPRTVWVDDFASTPDGLTVSLAPRDVPEQQDWRFLVGLTVLVSGTCEVRLARIAAACGAFAKRVIVNVHSPEPARGQHGLPTSPLLKITDTDGVLTWPT